LADFYKEMSITVTLRRSGNWRDINLELLLKSKKTNCWTSENNS